MRPLPLTIGNMLKTLASLFSGSSEVGEESAKKLFGVHSYLLKDWSQLTPKQREDLVKQFKSFDLDTAAGAYISSSEKLDSSLIKPMEEERVAVARQFPAEDMELFWAKGLEAIAYGKVAALVLAGGQASRLGSSEPKGMIAVDQWSDCNTLFALQAARIARLQKLARRAYPGTNGFIHWYVMASTHTVDQITKYFKENVDNFGLSVDNIHIFVQGEMPCFGFDGKLFFADKGKIAASPNGNGGFFFAVAPLLVSMKAKGIEYIHLFCVDNILCRVADPHFIGFCISKDLDCAAKVVEKTDPDESVGIICNVEGRQRLVEYSEIPKELSHMRDSSGRLAFRTANIANHMFTLDFLKQVCKKSRNFFPLHRAEKKIAFYDGEKVVKPMENNGVKLEYFITDVFGEAQRFYLWEVDRAQEFSPLKNHDSTGKDCLSTCIRDVQAEYRRWLSNAGAIVKGDLPISIHPLRSYAGEGLEEYNGCELETPCIITSNTRYSDFE